MKKIIKEFYDEVDFDAAQECSMSKKPSCVDCHSNSYYESTEIDYSCDNKRKLYVVRYLPVHIHEIRLALNLIPEASVKELLSKKKLNVACLGGGPGTDNLAFNKWLYYKRLFSKGNLIKVRVLRVDRCEEWDAISKRINYKFFPDDIELKRKKNNHDVIKHTLDISKKDKANIIIISYLISELDEVDLPKLVDNLKIICAEKANIVINDRNETAVKTKITKLFELLGSKFISQTNAEHCGFSYEDEIYKKSSPKVYARSINYVGSL